MLGTNNVYPYQAVPYTEDNNVALVSQFKNSGTINLAEVYSGTYVPSTATETVIEAGSAGNNAYYPVFSPDESQMAYIFDESGTYNIYTCDIDGTNKVQVVTSSGVTIGLNWRDVVV